MRNYRVTDTKTANMEQETYANEMVKYAETVSRIKALIKETKAIEDELCSGIEHYNISSDLTTLRTNKEEIMKLYSTLPEEMR